MSLIRRAAQTLDLRAAPAGQEFGNSTPPTNMELGGYGSAAGISVSQESALQIAAVYGCASLLSTSVASLPVRLLNNQSVRKAKELPLSPLLTEPYAEISALDFVIQFVSSLALRGNFFGHIISRDKRLFATQIKPIPADNAQVKRLQNGQLEYRFFNKVIPNKDVFHVKMLTLPGMHVGVNPIAYMRLTFSKSLAQSTYGAEYFKNSANPSLVIEVKGSLSPDQTRKMVRSFMGMHQGLNKAHLPAIVTEDTTVKPISITPQDSQFLQAMQFSAEEIASTLFRVPPHMLGLQERTSSWGRGIEAMEKGFTTNTLVDYTLRYEQAMTAMMPPGQFVNLDLSQRLRGDTLERAQAASFLMLAGVTCADEVRGTLFDLPPLPNGEGTKPYSPINTEYALKARAEAEQLMKQLKEPEQEPELVPAAGNGKGSAASIAQIPVK